MANNKTCEKAVAIKSTSRPNAQTRIIRDSSNMRSAYANVANVASGRKEIVLMFGIIQARHAAQAEVKVQLTDRITLNPFAAKKLSILLNNALRDYETLYGPLQIEPRRPETPTLQIQPFSKTERTDEKTGLLFQLTKNLNVEVGIERSFKVFEKTILVNRFLLGFKKNTIREKPHERILDICKRMDMPGDLLQAFEQHLPDAMYIHFGFEENERACVYKAYLEFYEKIEKEMITRPNTSDHFLMHLGFKWDALDNTKQALTSYTWYPFLSVENMVKKLSNILDPNKNRTPFELTKGILGIVSRRIPHHDILYLEVTEQDNPRKSFDINIYRANLQLSELYPFLLEMCRDYSIPPEEFHILYDSVRTQIFGHISGGIDREKRDFLTVYYGVEGIKDYGAKSGIPAVEAPLTARANRTTPPQKKSPFAGVERTNEKAGKLFQLVNSLNVQVGFERSFKVFQNTLLADRFLAGFKRKSIKQEPHESILNICRQIDMPEDFLDTFHKYLPESNIVLFGFEGNKRNCLYKAYLEFGHKITEVIKENPDKPEPFLIHRGFKWDASDNSQKATARYTCFPAYTVQDMLERLSNVFYSHRHKSPFEIAEGIINLAANRVGPYEFLYFEANETDNPRISFDINMYRANLRMKELYPFLLDIVRHYSIPDEQFHILYEAVSFLIFGHLTGGIDREGRDFLTVYFGEKGSSRYIVSKS